MESYRRAVCSAIVAVAAALIGAAPAAAGQIAYQRDGDIWLMSDTFASQHAIISDAGSPHIAPGGRVLVMEGGLGGTTAVYKLQNRAFTLLTPGLLDTSSHRQYAVSPEIGGGGDFDYAFVDAVAESEATRRIRGHSLASPGLGEIYDVCEGTGDSGYPDEPSPNPVYEETAFTGCENGGRSELRILGNGLEYGVASASAPQYLTQASYSPDGLDLVYAWGSSTGHAAIYVSKWNSSTEWYDTPTMVLDPSAATITSPRFIDGDLDGTGDWIIFGYRAAGAPSSGLYWINANGSGDAHYVTEGSSPAWVASSIYTPSNPPPPQRPPSGDKPLPPDGTTPRPVPNIRKALRSQLKSAAKALSKLGATKLLKRKGFKIKRFKAVVAGRASGSITRAGKRTASGSVRFKRAGRKTLYLKAPRKARVALARKIARGRAFKVKLTLKFKTRSGKTYTAGKSVKLKVPKRPRKPQRNRPDYDDNHTWLDPCIPAPWYMGGCLAY